MLGGLGSGVGQVQVVLKRTQADHDPGWHGWTWVIEDEDELARLVARIALGQARHVANILSRLGVSDSKTTVEMAEEAIERLTLEKDADPWHRDGWLFQAISWIAAHDPDKHVATRAPHIIQAHKGFDGVQLELAKDGQTIESILISEDKATNNPRAMIRDKVWPEIRALEAGAQSAELRQETTALLQQQAALFPMLDIDKAIDNVIWKDACLHACRSTCTDGRAERSACADVRRAHVPASRLARGRPRQDLPRVAPGERRQLVWGGIRQTCER